MRSDDPIGELVALLSRLPGIGERTATRLAHHMLAGEAEYTRALGESLAHIHERVVRCEECANFCGGPRCAICEDPKRDERVLCVVARVPDLSAIEKSGSFRGRYHVLHGLLAPLDGVGPDQLPLDDLMLTYQQYSDAVLLRGRNRSGYFALGGVFAAHRVHSNGYHW